MSRKKKYKKEKEKAASPDEDRLKALERAIKEDEYKASPAGSSRNSPAAASSSDRKTDAEKRFEEVQKKRVRDLDHATYSVVDGHVQLAAKVAKLANKSHKDRVNEFNSKLEALSEHHDIPKASYHVLDPTCRTLFLMPFSILGWTRVRRDVCWQWFTTLDCWMSHAPFSCSPC